MMLGLGLGLCNPSSSFTWTPLESEGVNGASVRVFRSDMGVTSASSATRWRTGVLSTDLLGDDALDPVDGAGFILLNDGRLLHIGGAPLGAGVNSVNTIRSSDDRGRTWSVLLSGEAGPAYTRFSPGHSLGICQDDTYGYVIGGDPILGANGEVWRTLLSGDGTEWELAATHAWLADRVLFWWGVLDNEIIIGGGQTDINDATTALASYYKLTDSGETSTLVGDAPFAARGAIAGALPVMDIGGTDELLLVGGGRYDVTEGENVYYDDVWSYKASGWTERLATGHGQFLATRYNTVVVHNGRAWLWTGSVSGDGDTAAIYTATVPGTWTATTLVSLAHGDSHARAAISTSYGILYDNGFQPGTPPQSLYVIREHTGALVSSWVDQGADGLTLLQATDASKPVLDTTGFTGKPGIVGTRGQIMTLAAPDIDIAAGIYEAWVIYKSLNHDIVAAQSPNAPATFVGNQTGSVWNSFGLNGEAVNYRSASPTTVSTDGTGANDDTVHVIGIQHTTSDDAHRVYLDGTLVATTSGATFSTSWNGWDSVLGGYLSVDNAEAVLAAVVIVRDHSVATDATFRSNLQRWAQNWGQ
jgi:hypothetical protein